ncbi:MAG: hypothetical protein JO179_07995 [Solirubrobacterales bacterium]|nr:hypothetical protein [Solirubrobacterales bacterium]
MAVAGRWAAANPHGQGHTCSLSSFFAVAPLRSATVKLMRAVPDLCAVVVTVGPSTPLWSVVADEPGREIVQRWLAICL